MIAVACCSTFDFAKIYHYNYICGYYYDEETGFYYLQSRYYDPANCRFINADGQINESFLGLNLFAYCENNPINRADPSGHFWVVVLTVVAVAAGIINAYHHISKRNYERNSKIDSNPLTTTRNKDINDQYGDTGENFEYGLYKADYNACETIAVHNIKVLNGVDSCLSDTMKDFQDSYAMIAYGYWGSNPFAIGRVLNKSGLKSERIELEDMDQPGSYIVSYWTGKRWNSPVHTIAITFDGNTYTAYNLTGDGEKHSIYPSWFSDSYFCGYRIIGG